MTICQSGIILHQSHTDTYFIYIYIYILIYQLIVFALIVTEIYNRGRIFNSLTINVDVNLNRKRTYNIVNIL